VQKVNIAEAFETIDEYWSQKTIGEANGQLFKLAKGTGATNWHKHDDQDELFIVYEGRLVIELRDRDVDLITGEMFIVPRGIEHRPVAHGEAHILVVGSTITSTKEGGKPN
jgi:mannose-6-phosphate isomerase-like protein (cupin superfamily)